MICETCSHCGIIDVEDMDGLYFEKGHIQTVYRCTVPLNVFCKEVRKCNKYKEEANVKKYS